MKKSGSSCHLPKNQILTVSTKTEKTEKVGKSADISIEPNYKTTSKNLFANAPNHILLKSFKDNLVRS